MAVDLHSLGQMSLFDQSVAWRTMVQVEPDHRLITLLKTIPWDGLMKQSIEIAVQRTGDIGNHWAYVGFTSAFGGLYSAKYVWVDGPVWLRGDPSGFALQDTALSRLFGIKRKLGSHIDRGVQESVRGERGRAYYSADVGGSPQIRAYRTYRLGYGYDGAGRGHYASYRDEVVS